MDRQLVLLSVFCIEAYVSPFHNGRSCRFQHNPTACSPEPVALGPADSEFVSQSLTKTSIAHCPPETIDVTVGKTRTDSLSYCRSCRRKNFTSSA